MNPDVLVKSGILRHLSVTVTGLLLLWTLARLVLPYVVKNQLESRLTEQLWRKVSLGRVNFKPWSSLELTVEDVAMAHAFEAERSAQFSIKCHYINGITVGLAAGPVVDAPYRSSGGCGRITH